MIVLYLFLIICSVRFVWISFAILDHLLPSLRIDSTICLYSSYDHYPLCYSICTDFSTGRGGSATFLVSACQNVKILHSIFRTVDGLFSSTDWKIHLRSFYRREATSWVQQIIFLLTSSKNVVTWTRLQASWLRRWLSCGFWRKIFEREYSTGAPPICKIAYKLEDFFILYTAHSYTDPVKSLQLILQPSLTFILAFIFMPEWMRRYSSTKWGRSALNLMGVK